MTLDALTATLRLDAVANVLAGVVLVPAAGRLAAPLGLEAAWPLRVLAVVLIVYGVDNALVAARPATRWLTALIAVDVGFGIALLAVAVTDPTGAATPARGVIGAVAVASLAMGLAKLGGRRRLSIPEVRAAHADPEPAGR